MSALEAFIYYCARGVARAYFDAKRESELATEEVADPTAVGRAERFRVAVQRLRDGSNASDSGSKNTPPDKPAVPNNDLGKNP